MAGIGAEIERLTAIASQTLGAEVVLLPQLADVGGIQVGVWTASLDALAWQAEKLISCLSEAERSLAAEMRVERASARFVGGRAALRALLGAAMRVSPADVRLAVGKHGKPLLDRNAHSEPLCFNVAHSGSVIAVAACLGAQVGIDVEQRRVVRDLDRLVTRALTPAERALFEGWVSEGNDRLDAFLRTWTVKEARLKALGLPIGAGLSREHPLAGALAWSRLALMDRDAYFAAVAVSPASS